MSCMAGMPVVLTAVGVLLGGGVGRRQWPLPMLHVSLVERGVAPASVVGVGEAAGVTDAPHGWEREAVEGGFAGVP